MPHTAALVAASVRATLPIEWCHYCSDWLEELVAANPTTDTHSHHCRLRLCTSTSTIVSWQSRPSDSAADVGQLYRRDARLAQWKRFRVIDFDLQRYRYRHITVWCTCARVLTFSRLFHSPVALSSALKMAVHIGRGACLFHRVYGHISKSKCHIDPCP